jgi:hypothetical protein
VLEVEAVDNPRAPFVRELKGNTESVYRCQPIQAIFRTVQRASGSSNQCNAGEKKGMWIGRQTEKVDRWALVWEGGRKFK